MHPIKTRESNFVYRGPTPEIADLPCRMEGIDTFCVFELSDEDRQLVAAGGVLRLGIHGVRPILPVSVAFVAPGGPFARVLEPCRVCCRAAEDPVHLAGPDTHAFRCSVAGEAK